MQYFAIRLNRIFDDKTVTGHKAHDIAVCRRVDYGQILGNKQAALPIMLNRFHAGVVAKTAVSVKTTKGGGDAFYPI